MSHNFKNRAVHFFLCRSGELSSRYFHNVLNAVINLEEVLLTQPNGEGVYEVISTSSRFYPLFKVYPLPKEGSMYNRGFLSLAHINPETWTNVRMSNFFHRNALVQLTGHMCA